MTATGLPDPDSLEPTTRLILASHEDATAIDQLFGVLGHRLQRILKVRSTTTTASEIDDIVQDSLLEAGCSRSLHRLLPR